MTPEQIRRYWKTRYNFHLTMADRISLVIIVLLGCFISFASAHLTARAQQDNQRLELENHSLVYFSHIEGALESSLDSLHALRGFFNASREVEKKEFSIFTDPMLSVHREIQSLAWVPLIKHQDREGHERLARSQGYEGYEIREQTRSGNKLRAAQSQNYFPVFFTNSRTVSELEPGYNLLQSGLAGSVALQNAMDSGLPIATRPIMRDISRPEQKTFLVIMAIYHSAVIPLAAKLRRENLSGFVVAVYHVSDFFKYAEENIKDKKLSVSVTDVTIPEQVVPIYTSASFYNRSNKGGKYRGELQQSKSYSRIIDIAGREWDFSIHYAKGLNGSIEWASVLVFCIGILFTGFVAAYVIGNSKRRSIIEDLIKERTKELAAVKDRVQQVLDNTGEGICGIDLHGNTSFVNQAALALMGYAEEDFLYVHLHSLIHHHYADGSEYPVTECKIYQAFTKGITTTTDDEVFWHKSGRPISVEYTATPMRDGHGNIKGAVVIFRDIRERKQRQFELIEARNNAEMASRAKTTFLATMSHEIRTPLNGMLGMAQLLERTPLETKQEEYIQVLMSSGRALLEQINDILDFSRIEAGKLVLENSTFDLSVCCSDLISLMDSTAADKGLSLQLNYAADCPRYFIGDRLRIRQILLNLIGNAIKFTFEGGVTLDISNQGMIGNKYKIFLRVRDTGIGIEPEQQASLFDSFSQVDASTTRKYGGSGLGLAISRQLAELMDGDISIQSVPGEGAEFCLIIALPASKENELDNKVEAVEKMVFSGRVLLVEDNDVNQQVAKSILFNMGLEVELANDGEEAIEKFQKFDFDLILMDCQMPIMDGYEATRRIRQFVNGKEIPILALTANVLPEDVKRCIEAGMNECVHKPIEVSVLQQNLKQWLPCEMQHDVGDKTMSSNELPPQADTSGLVNMETLDTLAGLMGSVFGQLIPSYIDSSDKCFNEARSLVEAQDFEVVERLFHSLKSSSRNLGADPLGVLAASLEEAMRNQQPDKLEPDLTEAENMYQQVRKILLDYNDNR